MNPLLTFSDLTDYQKEIELQRAALKTSSAFSPIEKIRVTQIYDELNEIVEKRINHLRDLKEAVNL